MASNPLLKDLITPLLMRQVGQSCQQLDPSFANSTLTELVNKIDFSQLELKARIRHCATALYQALDRPFVDACALLKLVSPLYPGLPGLIFSEVVEQYGLNDVCCSFDALAHFTCDSTAEFAIRAFLVTHPEQTWQQLNQWAESDNFHLRRLASEGCRPRLPWARNIVALRQDPEVILTLLSRLKADPSEYVRRSVANNLNDIAKDHPARVLGLLRTWYGQQPETNWIIKHGLRTLLKQRHPVALELLGYASLKPQVQLQLIKEEIALGQTLTFVLQLSDLPRGKLRIEFGLHFAAKATKARYKVFQLLDKVITEPQLLISHSYRFVDLTTRKHYSGQHQLSIIINGLVVAERSFLVTPSDSLQTSAGF